MPFITKHVRLTNSGRLPDIFLMSKVQAATELADSHLGKLFFVLQIDSPWKHASPIGSSIINMIGREYYRQEGHVPLENFERALAKANRLIEQLIRDGETSCVDHLHALIALVVGDDLHIAYTGGAEAYFLRDGKINLITEPGKQRSDGSPAFANVISGEISAGDVVILGSPSIYEAITSDDLGLVLKEPLVAAAKALARRLKALRIRHVNAIILHFDTLRNSENNVLTSTTDTIYLDQRIDSLWHFIRYYGGMVLRPLGKGLAFLGRHINKWSQKGWAAVEKKTKEVVAPQAQKLLERTGASSSKALAELGHKALPAVRSLTDRITTITPKGLRKEASHDETDGVAVHHYTTKQHTVKFFQSLLRSIVRLAREVSRQFVTAFRRSPRIWYIISALVILSAIGASIQTRNTRETNPVATTVSLDEMKKLITEADQARVYGNNDKARQLLVNAVAKGEQAKQNPKLVEAASQLLGQVQRDLDVLSAATHLTVSSPLLTLSHQVTEGIVHDGTFYDTTSDGKLYRTLLTGGESTLLVEIPDAQAINQLLLDANTDSFYLQTYTGKLYVYQLKTEKLRSIKLATGDFPLSTGLGLFNGTLYLLDPADNEIWKHTKSDNQFAEAVSYLKNKKANLSDGINISIDGSVFVLHKSGIVTKFSRGALTDWHLTNLPVPFDKIKDPLDFIATEDASNYYLTERGSDTIPPRIIEFDKSGKFLHQFFLPYKWQKDIRLIHASPKSHKAWVLVNKDLYEFMLVQ